MAQDAFGLTSLYDPSIAVDEAALQRQMLLAQALRQQSMDAQGRTQMAGNVAIRNSPLEGVAKVVQALRANQLDTQNDTSRQGLSQKTMAAMAQLLRGQDPGMQQAPAPVSSAGQGSGLPAGVTPAAMAAGGFPQPQAAPQPAPQPQQAPAPGGMNLAQLLRGGVIGQVGGPGMAAAYAKQFEPTDIERQVRAAGYDPASPEGQKFIRDNLEKQNYIAPVSGRPGGYLQDPRTRALTNLPHVPDGFQAKQDGQGGFSIVPVQGGPEAISGSERQKTLGKNDATPQQVWDGSANGGKGGYVFSTVGQTVRAANPSVVTPQEQSGRNDQRLGILQAELAQETDPANRAAIQREIAGTQRAQTTGQPFTVTRGGPVAAAPPLGMEQGAEAQQKALSTKWEALQSQNREASNTKSYLQNIVQAARNGAVTGPGAERREMIQGMLQLAGINEKVNENATTQTQLLDKYHNQIVTRLGSGGLGTDAARAMLDSAYPGKPMNMGAIEEAAANLNGAQDMVQAKTRFLQEQGVKQDAGEYARREILFDQAADPRIWQWKNMQNPEAKKAFARSLVQQDPSLPQRIKALEAAGAL